MRPVLCPVVVGRDDELALLDGELLRARNGSGGVAFLVGEAGIGKSRLAREAEAHAAVAGMIVLRGRAVQSVAPVPFRPLAEALQSALRDRPAQDPTLAPYRAALGQLVPDWAGAPAPQQASPLVVLEAVVRLLRSLAGHHGLLLVLEDLHWADADTISVIEYLADNLASEAVLCLGTVRSDESSPAARLAESLAARRAAVPIQLQRLPAAVVTEMVAACLPNAGLSPEVVDVLRRRAEGVPFLVEELLTTAFAENGAGARARVEQAVPASYRDLVRSRLGHIPVEGRAVVEAAAVLGRTFDWTLIREITGLTEEQVLEALRSAVEAQLLSSAAEEPGQAFEFRHALLRESILAELLPPERQRLSLRAADVIEESRPGVPGELCELAADLRERGGDRDGAFRLLIEAARRGLARTALSTAELTAERARRLGAGDPWWEMGADLVLAEILSMAAKADRLREVGARALQALGTHASLATPDRLATVHLRIARGLVEAGDPALAQPHVEMAAELAPDETLATRVQAVRARVALAGGDLEAAAASATEALTSAERLGLDEATCDALLVEGRLAVHRGDLEAAAKVLGRARLVADRADLTLSRVRILLDLALVDELSTAELGHAQHAAELAARTGAVSAAAGADLQMARLHLLRFEVAPAKAALDRCLEASRRFTLRLLPQALAVRASLVARAGPSDEADEAFREATDAGGPLVQAPAWGEARAVASLVGERRAGARKELDRAMELAPRSGPPLAWTFPGLWVLVRTMEEPTDRTDVEADLSAVGALVHRANGGCLGFAEAIWLGREGRAEEAAARFGEADEVAAPFPWHRHVARRLVAEAAIADGWGQPGRWLREDLPFFEGAGYDRTTAACKGLLRRAGERVPRRGRGESDVPAELAGFGVTSREVDVLRLIGEGLSNREIAERLFVSPRTVQTHAISLLRKLRLDSRAQLVAFAARSESPAEG